MDEDKDGLMLKAAILQHELQTQLLALWKSMPYRNSWSEMAESRFWQEGSVSTYQVSIERSNVGIYSFGGWYDDFRREGLVAFSNLHNTSKWPLPSEKHTHYIPAERSRKWETL